MTRSAPRNYMPLRGADRERRAPAESGPTAGSRKLRGELEKRSSAAPRYTTKRKRARIAAILHADAHGHAFRRLRRLARRTPSGNSVRHHAHVRVAGFDRPTGGLVRSHSMLVMAVENQLRVLVGRQFLGYVVVAR